MRLKGRPWINIKIIKIYKIAKKYRSKNIIKKIEEYFDFQKELRLGKIKCLYNFSFLVNNYQDEIIDMADEQGIMEKEIDVGLIGGN